MEISRVIKGIRQTEKGARLVRVRQYVLQVAKEANKPQIKQAAEALFKVSVVKVNTQIHQGKWRRLTGRWGRRPDWKKAIITVAEGQKIELK
jgi:large subunit ribosomal protein L23